MAAPSDCPSPEALAQFLLGQVSDLATDELDRHVERCPRCAANLGRVAPSDTLVEAVRAAATLVSGPPYPTLAAALVPVLKGLCFREATRTWSGTTLPPAEELSATGPALAPSETAGDLGRVGRFRVLGRLGAGGMGVVYRAHDPRLNREVALKVISPRLLSRPGMADRFLHEARAAAAVEHDNIVSVYEAEEADGVPYLAMPLLRGETLAERLARAGGPLPTREVVRLGREAAAGLAAAHARGLVHRDVKPGNIWLEAPASPLAPPGRGAGGEGWARVKVLDFGLAQAMHPETGWLSAEGVIAGTPAYMAPEQARAQGADHRADLFSLGCVLYEAATGRRAFPGGDPLRLVMDVLLAEPPAPAALNRRLPAELDRLIRRLLAKAADDRPASADEVVAELARLDARLDGPRRLLRVWLALAAALLLVSAGAWLWQLRQPPVEHEAPHEAPPEPVAVRFELDGDTKFVLAGDEERTVDLRDGATLPLPPRDYTLKPAGDTTRRLVPDRLVVQANTPLTVRLALVGEAGKHEDHSRAVSAVAFARRGQGWLIVSASEDRSVSVWDTAKPGPPTAYQHPTPLRALAVSADGARVAAGGGDKADPRDLAIHLWALDGWKPDGAPLAEHRSLVTALAFAPDGQKLLSGDASGVTLVWDLKTRKVLPLLDGHDASGVNAAAVSPDGKRGLTGGGDGQAILWDLPRAEVICAVNAHRDGTHAVAFLPDGRGFVTAGADGLVRVWVPDGRTFKARDLKGHTGPVLAAAVSADGRRLVTGGADGTVRVWDLAGDAAPLVLSGHKGEVRAIALTPDGRRAASGGADRTVRFWSLPH